MPPDPVHASRQLLRDEHSDCSGKLDHEDRTGKVSGRKSVLRGKRRSPSQRIGEVGESLFAAWAVENGLTATKASFDYGLDFYCAVFRENPDGVEEASGALITAQVRSTAADRNPTISLNRVDAVNLLRQDQATCLIGIAASQGRVHFRFLDDGFIDNLFQFLASKRDRFKLRLSSMSTAPERFRRDLTNAVRPSTLHRLKIHRAELLSRLTLPTAEIAVKQTSRGGSAEIRAPWVGDAFLVHPEARERVRVDFFGLGKAPDLPDPGIQVHPYLLLPVLDLADSEIVIHGGLEGEVSVSIRNGDEYAEAIFKLRKFGDEQALTHASGLCLIWSNLRPRANGSTKIDFYTHRARGTVPLGSVDRAFFDLLKPGSEILADVLPPLLRPLYVDQCGRELARIASCLRKIDLVFSSLGLDMNNLFLSDCVGTEFAASLIYLEALLNLNYSADELFPAFVWTNVGISSLAKRGFVAKIPLVLNMHETGVVLWLDVKGSAYLSESGEMCGIAIEHIKGWKTERHPRFTKSQYPELWLFEDLEGMQFGAPRTAFRIRERAEKTPIFMKNLTLD